jgi:hypothetical protein
LADFDAGAFENRLVAIGNTEIADTHNNGPVQSIGSGGCFFLAHDLIRKPVATFRDHARD